MKNGRKGLQQASESYREIDLTLIDPPQDVARIDIPFEAVKDLAQSIKQQGLLQPIVVCERDGRFEVAAGHRRYLAHKYLKYTKISCKVIDSEPKVVALARATENIQSKDLSPLEEGLTYQGLVEKLEMSIEEIGDMMGVSPGIVKRRLNILKMPESLIDAVHKRQISQTVAEELVRCPDNAYREYLIEMARDHGATKEVVRGWVDDRIKELRRGESASVGGGQGPDVYVERKAYIGCYGCDSPVEVTEIKTVSICPRCAEAFVDFVKSRRNQKEGSQ